MSLQHGDSCPLYSQLLQAAINSQSCSDFVRTEDSAYGLHNVLPQLVVPVPPSARTAGGNTRVLRKSTAAPRTSSIRFTVFLLSNCELDRDSFMGGIARRNSGSNL